MYCIVWHETKDAELTRMRVLTVNLWLRPLFCMDRKGREVGRKDVQRQSWTHKKKPLPGILNIIYYVYQNFKVKPTETNTKREEKDIVHTHSS